MLEIGLLPSGHLHCFESSEDGKTDGDAQFALANTFARDSAEGLIQLAAEESGADGRPSLLFWRLFACHYLNAKCLLPERSSIETPAMEPDAVSLLSGLPPMRGAEYLSVDALEALWRALDAWVNAQAASLGGFGHFLEKKAPRWHPVGRICFHLAENKNNEDFPFAFMVTYAPELKRSGQVRHLPLSRALAEYAGANDKKALIRLLSPVQLASESSALVRDLMETGDLYHPLAWTPAEAYAFLQEIPSYEKCGVVVRVPDWWKKRPRPRVAVTIGNRKASALGLNALLDFKLSVSLGDDVLDKGELKALFAAADGLAFIKGRWVEVDQEKLQQALAHWKTVEKDAAESGISFVEGMRLLAGAPADLARADAVAQDRQWAMVQPGKWLADLLETLRHPAATNDLVRSGLKTALRGYQKTGVHWLWLLTQLGLGACLADDMGLGKTVQVIALLLLMKEHKIHKPSLLVLPASLLANWRSELARFAPGLHCRFIHASQTDKKTAKAASGHMSEEDETDLAGVDVVLTTYGTLMRQAWLQKRDWQLLVLDEAQAIKNPNALQSKAVKSIKASGRIALTGTPVENQLSDLWSLFDFLNPGLLGSATRFKTYVKSLSQRETDQYAPLRHLVGPYILRRLKTDKTIIDDLPEKTELPVYCGLSPKQTVLYKKTILELSKALLHADGIKRRGLVLSYLMRFKQICNHPSQFLGDGDYVPDASGKFVRLGELCEEIASRQQKMLVFTQFREMTEPLADFLTRQFNARGLVLHGGTPVKQRQKYVEQFQKEDGPPFFILSLKAGGTGLNLTEASHVVHFDRWWNPAVENQATDRAFRIGQKKNVLVHKFVCLGTVEEKINAMIEEKSSLAGHLLAGGAEMLLTEMEDKELIKLVSLDIEKSLMH